MRLLKIGATYLVLTAGVVVFPSPAYAVRGPQDPTDSNSQTGAGGDGWAHGDPAPRNTYCDGFPDHTFKRSQPWDQFQFADGSTRWQLPELTPFASVPTYQRYSVFCDPNPDTGGAVEKLANVWYPYISPDSVAYQYNLIAKVEAQLQPPELTWLNKDIDHDWLWVRVEHYATIEPVPDVHVAHTATNQALNTTAHAWITATPTEFTIEIPGVDGTDGTTTCDITTITSDNGCPIRFTHASSIDPTGQFTINTTLTYTVESNSGKYQGITFTRDSTTTITVAEAMAVTVRNN